MNKNIFFQLFGWYGTLAIIGAYYLNSFGLVDAQSVLYQVLNISGALGIILISYLKGAYQPMALNLVWFIIGVFALSALFI